VCAFPAQTPRSLERATRGAHRTRCDAGARSAHITTHATLHYTRTRTRSMPPVLIQEIESIGSSSPVSRRAPPSAAESAVLDALAAEVRTKIGQMGAALNIGFVRHRIGEVFDEDGEFHRYVMRPAQTTPHAVLVALVDACWERFLLCSLIDVGELRLPIDVHLMHRTTINGNHVVQLVTCEDVAHSHAELAERPVREDRMWKMILTDGEVYYTAVEKNKCADMTHAAMQPGIKVSAESRSASSER
jgi:hypothetical protein